MERFSILPKFCSFITTAYVYWLTITPHEKQVKSPLWRHLILSVSQIADSYEALDTLLHISPIRETTILFNGLPPIHWDPRYGSYLEMSLSLFLFQATQTSMKQLEQLQTLL